jgi:Fe-Mn family superoxide dismutase
MFIKKNLPYSYNSLEPFINSEIMQIHYEKHHTTYLNNLNNALSNYNKLFSFNEKILANNLNSIPSDIRNTVKNNLGGHINHSIFWNLMTPLENEKQPTASFLKIINENFESFENFLEIFKKTSVAHFGSGWVWLIKNEITLKLEIKNYINQDTPYYEGLTPILGIDLWEHAYYLQYQNRRIEYIENWLKTVNWKYVSSLFFIT